MPQYVTPEETLKHLLQWSIFDVRSQKLYNEGHIQGTQWLDVQNLTQIAQKQFQKNEHFLLYDTDDNDHNAKKTASILENQGFTGVLILQGGYLAWRKLNYPNKRLLLCIPKTT